MLISVKKWVTKMFMGEYRHSIDAKGRLIIPSKLREQCGSSVVVTRGFDGCLALYPQEEWTRYYQKLQMLPRTKKEARNFVRIITSKASECEFDKLGRINIPNVLKIEGKLEKECVIVGVGDYIEIWNASLWQNYYDLNKDKFDGILESLDGFDL